MTIPINQKYLLDIKEIMAYTGWGECKVRKLLNHPMSNFTVRNGAKLYANRKKLELYLDAMTDM